MQSGLWPDNLLWNEQTENLVVIEMKDVAELNESHIRKVEIYMAEVGATGGFVPIAWDTEVSRRVRRIAKKAGIRIRRLEWRR